SGGWGNSATMLEQVEISLQSVWTRMQQIEQEQAVGQGEILPGKRGKVAGAIIGLINALRDKSTKKNEKDQ
ncbi:MAG TPA: hypothetical protein VGH84_01325, partial [Steroidobacteraceae bacterium]